MTKKLKIADFQVVFTKDGHLCEQDHHYMILPNHIHNYIREQNKLFNDTLEYTGYRGGRTNSHVLFKSTTTNRTYHMTMSLFDEVIQAKKFIDNKITGDFYFCKKGVTQSIKLWIR